VRKLQKPICLTLVIAAAAATVVTVPASAQPYRVLVELPDGTLQSLVLDLAPGTTLNQLPELPGTPVSLQIKAKVTATGAKSISSAISATDQPDPQAGNNTANTTVTPVLAALKVTQVVNTRIATVGGVVLVTLTVRNTGPGTARNVAVTESLGSGLLFVRALTPTRGTFVPGTKVWNIPALGAGMSAMVQIVAQVAQTGQVQATASTTGAGIDPALSQLDSTASLTAVRSNLPAGWSYFSGQGFRPGPAPTPRSAPATPVLSPTLATSVFAQMLLTRGFILPSGYHL